MASKEKVKKQFPHLRIEGELRGSYNIAPTQAAYLIANDQPRQLQRLNWGLVPHWAQDTRSMGKLINARGEDIHTRPSFRLAFRRQRCIVLADSFYEWRKDGSQRLPYRIHARDYSLLAMAGVWDLWEKNGQSLRTFSIITTIPNNEMSQLHDRMPVLLQSDSLQQQWLAEGTELAALTALLRPANDGLLQFYRISEEINSPANDYADLQREVRQQPTLFD